ncbi:MAG: tRNA lysidine(34) synthetase TilS [Clostridiales bacterium]|jgi:tRNA(Ile)-lysidine synthase|nr:tRNA lysidine(34) synthetase TilS [Clostridiales bacterium]
MEPKPKHTPIFLKFSRALLASRGLEPGRPVLVGLSGGADSVCLLRLFLESAETRPLSALHCDHGLRGAESGRDAAFCARLCAELGVPLETAKLDVLNFVKESKLSVEEAARILRLKALRAAAREKGALVALAHNMNDVAETVLFNMARGCGMAGLCGISPEKDGVIRPLLGVSRAEIEEYLAERNYDYVTDSTNLQNDYTRNKIRNLILPLISGELNPRAVSHISRLAAGMREENGFLDALAEEALENCVFGENALDIDRLKTYHNVLRRRAVLKFIQNFAGTAKDIAANHVDSALGLLYGNSGGRVSLPYSVTARREFGRLLLEKTPSARGSLDFAYDLSGGPVFIKELNLTAAARPPRGLVARNPRRGDRIFFRSINGHKSVKKLLIEKKIPERERGGVLIIASGSEVFMIYYGGTAIYSDFPGFSDTRVKVEREENQ